MKHSRFLASLALVMLFVFSSAYASASVANCLGSTTLATYMASGYSCQIDNLLFSNFSDSASANPSGIAIVDSGVNVLLITTLGAEGLDFNPGINVGTQQNGTSSFQDLRINFEVSTIDGSASLTDLHLSMNGSYTGTGLTGVTEQYCLGGPLISCAPANSGQIQGTNPPAIFNAQVAFGGVSSIYVSKDINGTSGINGTAAISDVTNTFSQVPEPASLVLMGFGLLGLGVYRRQRGHRN